MATATETSGAAATMRRLLRLKNCLAPPDLSPLISGAAAPAKKSGFAALRDGLGCSSAASSQAFAPTSSAAAVVRSSADWQGKRSRRPRRVKHKKKSGGDRRHGGAVAGDVWCAPGMAFAADASVDCVIAPVGRSDRSANIARRGGGERLASLIDTPEQEMPLFGGDVLSAGQLRQQLRGCRRSPGGLDEIMMFQTRLLLGALDACDQYRDLRLDVDGMSYEELLELGDKIGYVSTGLREEEILCCLRKSKNPYFTGGSSFRLSEMERKCCICQEEYEVNDEMGRLYCGHSYHAYCIKQWLLQKNACPVCKSVVTKS